MRFHTQIVLRALVLAALVVARWTTRRVWASRRGRARRGRARGERPCCSAKYFGAKKRPRALRAMEDWGVVFSVGSRRRPPTRKTRGEDFCAVQPYA
ncbi:hypothetical protein B0H16DRAFT_1654020 [Mycena metata]|uniref:Uncharacterized protein n=1 Tax=Mycena metata TaxID=1033252 RepID=A0AAD7DHX6_9AGAR|nr:hypothetical protein B0H16DRAFT_1654020 [Mycena metata]